MPWNITSGHHTTNAYVLNMRCNFICNFLCINYKVSTVLTLTVQKKPKIQKICQIFQTIITMCALLSQNECKHHKSAINQKL